MAILDRTKELDENFEDLKSCAPEHRPSRSESEQLALDLDYDYQTGQNMLQMTDNPLLTTDSVETPGHGFPQSTMVNEQSTPANDEQQGTINISNPRRRRGLEGKATAIRYSVLSQAHVSKQLDRFIAGNGIHENEQMGWESLEDCELLCYKCIKIIKSDSTYAALPEEHTYVTPKEAESPSNGREEILTTAEEHLQDPVLLETTQVCAVEQQKPVGTARSPWACISVENQMFEQLNTKWLGDIERRALQLHEKHFGKTKYNWRNIDGAAEKLWNSQRFDEAEELDRMAIELAEHHWGADNEDTLVLKGNLASTLWTQGRYNEAGQLEAAVVKALEISQGLDGKDTLWYQNNLSTTFRTQGRLEEAKTLSLDIVKRATKKLGEDHEDTLLFKVNLARAHQVLCQWTEAKKLLVTITKSGEKIWGFSNRKTLQAYILLGSILQSLELWDEAKAINEHVEREIIRSAYPNPLLWTLEFMDNLAEQFFRLGQYFEAEAIFREQASQRERLLSARHPQTLSSTIGIANCLHLQRKARHATEIGQHVLTVLKEVLGDDHPSTLTVMANLTWYEFNTLNLHDFVSKMTRVHRLRQAKLGDDNPDTVKSRLFIAWGQCKRGKFQESQEIFDSTHAHLIKIHGSENHPDVVDWVRWKAEACVMNGQDEEAERLWRKAYQLTRKTFGERHLSTLINAKHLINSISRLGRHNEAEEMISKMISIISDILGSQHPLTTEFVQIKADISFVQRKWAKAESLYARVLKAYEPYGEQHPYVIFGKATLAEALSWQGQFPEAEKLLQSALDGAKNAFDHGNNDSASLLALAAEVKRAQAKYSDAEELCRQTLRSREKVLGEKHPDTLASMNNLARVLQDQGKYSNAEELYRQILKAREDVLGKQHPYTLTSMSNLALVLRDQGKYSDAEELDRQTLRAREEVLGKQHLNTLTSMNNLAWVLRDQRKYSDAEDLHRQTLKGREDILGKKHLDTLKSMNNLAQVLQDQRKYSDAEELHRQILKGREDVLGEKHLDTLASMNSLARVLRSQGKYSDAEELYRQTLRGREDVLGEKHLDTLASMNSLARVLRSQGKYSNAEELYRQTLKGREDVLGEKHPDTFRSLGGLAVTLRCQCNYEAAEALQKQALTGLKEMLGADHQDTIASMENLSVALWYRRKYSEGQELILEVLGKRKKLGEEHPLFLASIGTLAAFREQGESPEAERLLRVQLNGLEKVLGKKHPDTLHTMHNIAWILQDQGKCKDAEELYRQTLKGREEILGKKHLDTLKSMNNLARVLQDQGKYSDAEELNRQILQARSI
jgi:tetratricopeptide (TPR) repeat protein